MLALPPCCLSSSALKLEGVRRVWGKEGYLAQTEAAATVEETAQVEGPSPLGLSGLQEGGSSSQAPIAAASTGTRRGTESIKNENMSI